MGGRYELWGWVLFLASGVVFFIAALREGDAWLAWGSAAWLLGVAFFLLDLRSRRR